MYKGTKTMGQKYPVEEDEHNTFLLPQKVCAHFFGGLVKGGPFFSTPQFHINSLVQFCGCMEAALLLNRGLEWNDRIRLGKWEF